MRTIKMKLAKGSTSKALTYVFVNSEGAPTGYTASVRVRKSGSKAKMLKDGAQFAVITVNHKNGAGGMIKAVYEHMNG